ncbi:MAG: YifB family Mg chelatase-like AAA ATPase [Propionibacteriaceae bacterium]|nr:YifB family Mg chelatase-like AAA ATPase [Propionibacteriaceae bacterium]
MMTASAWSVALIGIDGEPVEVEVAKGGGLPRIALVGLPDAALTQAKERVRAAVLGAGLEWHSGLVTINLTPANLPKAGTHYDLAIAAAQLTVTGQLPPTATRGQVFWGELGLDGRVRRVPGILPALLAAFRAGFEVAYVPASQAAEAALVPGIRAIPLNSLQELCAMLRGQLDTPQQQVTTPTPEEPEAPLKDFRDVHGHIDGRWAMEVAAAGRHHVFLHGAPGVGKTMLASRLPSILPSLDGDEAVEVSALHSLAGEDLSSGLLLRPPYADPHHSSTAAAIIGGGARTVRPGAISLAHKGVLFLDEAPEFGSRVLDSLRTPLESGWVTIGRAAGQVRYPASFQLVLAANPCPCGFSGVTGKECTCAPLTVRRYQERLSGPVMDRIDIRHHMLPVRQSIVVTPESSPESSAAIAERVAAARQRQRHRLQGTPWRTNGEVPGPHLRRELPLPIDVSPLEKALARGQLSARGVDKVLRLAWTVADLAGEERISSNSLRVAMSMRLGTLGKAA